MHKELIERLRAGSGGMKHWQELESEAADAIEALQAEHERMQTELQNSITRRQEQMAAADFAVASLKTDRDEYQKAADAMAWSHKAERDTLKQQLSETQAEIKRLQVEVCNRNRRALEGDKAKAAFDQLYTEHEELRIQVEASMKQEPVSYIYGLMGDEDYSSTPVYAAPVVADDAQRDAKRYQWLRQARSQHAQVMTWVDGLDEWVVWHTAEDVDTSIDAAMKGTA
jgi:hypothetical protein